VAGGWWLVAGGWWLVAGGWWLESINALPEGAVVRVAYTAPHALDADTDTVPPAHRLAVAQYAAHMLCQQLNALRQSTAAVYDQAEALELQNRVYGEASTALIDLNIAQLEKQRLDLEATDNVIPGRIKQLEKEITTQKRLRAAMAKKDSKD